MVGMGISSNDHPLLPPVKNSFIFDEKNNGGWKSFAFLSPACSKPGCGFWGRRCLTCSKIAGSLSVSRGVVV
jgi:hypothetical protein